MTNFTSEDVSTTIVALAVFALLVVPPAWLLCLATNPFSFNRLNVLRKVQLIIITSVSALPSLDFLIGKFLGFETAALFNLCCSGLLGVALIVKWRQRKSKIEPTENIAANSANANLHTATIIAILFALLWAVIAIASLVDWQTAAGTIFPSITVQDYVKNIAITDAVRRTGVPPITPMFLTEHKDKLFYYYFWFMLCGLGPTLTHGAVTARAAVMAGTAWVGIAVFSLAAFSSAQLAPGRTNRWRVAIIACVLVFVTGLDLIPVTLGNMISLSHGGLPLFESVDWWNVFLNNFSSSTIGIPQHTDGLVCGFFTTLLLRDLQKFRYRGWREVPLAVLCLASAPGLSIYVTIAFVLAWALWLILSLRETSAPALKRIMITALSAMCLAAPYVLEMIKANHSHNGQLAFYVRPITIVNVLIHPLLNHSVVGTVIENAIYFFILPINYFLELGFFFIASFLFWRGRKPKNGDEKLLLVVFWVSLIGASFVRSTVANNDFGWRSTLPAQFALLLWSSFFVADVFAKREQGLKPLKPITSLLVAASFAIGLGGSIYDLVMLRIAHSIGMRSYVGVNDGQRNYDLRDLYEKISNDLPESVIMQHNPEVLIDTYAGNYGNRQVVFSDKTYGTLMGTDYATYTEGSAAMGKMFKDASFEEMDALRRKYGITVLVVKTGDPIWSNKDGWPRKLKPFYQNNGGAIYRFDI